MTETTNYPRSLYEARLDAEFFANFHSRHVRYWRKLRGITRFLTALAGSAAAMSWLSDKPVYAGAAGILLAAMVALDQATEPADQLARHREMMRRYRCLLADPTDDLSTFDARLQALHADIDAPGFDGLRVPAFNDVVMAAGRREHALPMTAWNRLMGLLA